MKKKVFAICGSTRALSSNLKFIQTIANLTKDAFDLEIFESLAQLPHFNPDLDNEKLPTEVAAFRQKISSADAVLICTPEYVFSLPGSLKNALEWTVSTIIFSEKPVGLVTASGGGRKGHTQLKMVMKVLGAKFNRKTCLLISGVKGKMDAEGNIKDEKTRLELEGFVSSFRRLLK